MKDYPCTVEGCVREFDTQQGLSMHTTRSHKTPQAKANDMFELVGQATEVLFPAGIPMSRLIEIADWQKVTLRMLAR
jgi:hypothetical protein